MTKLILTFDSKEDAENFERRLKAFALDGSQFRAGLLRTSVHNVQLIEVETAPVQHSTHMKMATGFEALRGDR